MNRWGLLTSIAWSRPLGGGDPSFTFLPYRPASSTTDTHSSKPERIVTVKESLEALALTVIVACAVVVTVLTVRRESKPAVETIGQITLRDQDDWESLAEGVGSAFGSSDPSITVIEFSDFYCPYCRSFSKLVKQANLERPGAIRVVYRHYPVTVLHPTAKTAAIAAACATFAGRFQAYHDLLFEADSLPANVDLVSTAYTAGIADTGAFRSCLASARAREAVERDSTIGDSIGVNSTPTIIVNGKRFAGLPSAEDFNKLIDSRKN